MALAASIKSLWVSVQVDCMQLRSGLQCAASVIITPDNFRSPLEFRSAQYGARRSLRSRKEPKHDPKSGPGPSITLRCCCTVYPRNRVTSEKGKKHVYKLSPPLLLLLRHLHPFTSPAPAQPVKPHMRRRLRENAAVAAACWEIFSPLPPAVVNVAPRTDTQARAPRVGSSTARRRAPRSCGRHPGSCARHHPPLTTHPRHAPRPQNSSTHILLSNPIARPLPLLYPCAFVLLSWAVRRSGDLRHLEKVSCFLLGFFSVGGWREDEGYGGPTTEVKQKLRPYYSSCLIVSNL